jgi:transposase-like protein
MDQERNRVDSRLSKQRDLAAAKAFFEQTLDVAERPKSVVNDQYRSSPCWWTTASVFLSCI